MIKEVLEQCFVLDSLHVDKEEMHHPHKHILIDKEPVLIDFERAHYTEKPQNVTQFCQFLINQAELLNTKQIKIKKRQMIEVAKQYRKNSDIQPILKMLK